MASLSFERCEVDGCERERRYRGLCTMHHQQIQKNGRITSVESQRTGVDHSICAVEGCKREVHGRGYCTVHYRRWKRTGYTDLYDLRRILWGRVDYNGPNGCWLYVGKNGKPRDYGALRIRGERRGVHRLAYEGRVGAIPDGMVVRHLCHNPQCVNPDHLEVGTPADNSQDTVDVGGHVHGERAYNTRLCADDVRRIRRLWREGVPQTELGRMYDLTNHAIWRIVHRKNWAHVD